MLNVDDSFKKIIVLGEECPVTRDEHGITTMSVFDFLLKENSGTADFPGGDGMGVKRKALRVGT